MYVFLDRDNLKQMVDVPFHHDDPLVYSYGSIMADTSRYSPHKCNTRNGGAGLSRQQAISARAAGESIERYCSNFYDKKLLKFGAFTDFIEYAVHPS